MAQLYIVKAKIATFDDDTYIGYDISDALSKLDSKQVKIISNSWGTKYIVNDSWNFGYDSVANIADSYVNSNGMTIIFSAGNEGNFGSPTTITRAAGEIFLRSDTITYIKLL